MEENIIVVRTIDLDPEVILFESLEEAREFLRKDFVELAETNIGSDDYNDMVRDGYCSYSEDFATLIGYHCVDISWKIFSW